MVENIIQTKNKNQSQMSSSGLSSEAEQLIKNLNEMHGQSKQKILDLIKTLRTKDRLKDHEIKKILLERVKFVSRSAIYEYMPTELKREYVKPPLKEQEQEQTPERPDETVTETVTEHKPDPDWNNDFNEQLDNDNVPTTTIDQPKVKLSTTTEMIDPELEYLKDENKQLKEALKQLQTFTPATVMKDYRPEKREDFIPSKTHDKIDTVQYKVNVRDGKEFMREQMEKFTEYVTKDFSQLKSHGWKWVEVTIQVTK